MQKKKYKINLFWTVAVIGYLLSIFFSYYRIYIQENYPVFYSEEEIPDVFDSLIIFK